MKKILFILPILALLAACSNYGKKEKSGSVEVYYKDGISREDAQRTAELFDLAVQEGAPDSKQKKSFQLSKPGDTLLLKMVVDASRLDAVPAESFYAILHLVSDSVFGGKAVNMELTDNRFKMLRAYAYREKEESESSNRLVSGNVEVFATDGFSTEWAQNLADFLDRTIHPANLISFVVARTEAGYSLVKMASTREKSATLTEADVRDMTRDLSDSVFYGGSVIFQVTDTLFNRVYREYKLE